MYLEFLSRSSDTNRQSRTVIKNSLKDSFSNLIPSLPLTYTKNPHYRHYASLSGKELFEQSVTLIEQPTFKVSVKVNTPTNSLLVMR